MTASERWDTFLAQIEARHDAVRKEAASSAYAAIATLAGIDASPLSRLWSAAEARLKDLEQRIGDTWREKVDDAYIAEGSDAARRAAGYEKGDALRFALENAREETQQRLFADAAGHLFAQGLASRRDRFCMECGRPLEVPLSFRAIELRCDACGAQVVFEPGDLLRGAAAVGAHALSQQAAQEQWLAMRVAERRVRAARSPCPLSLLKDYERAQIAYFRAYVAARAKIEPELGRDPAKEVRSRMAHWYEQIEAGEPEWRRAGCPRENIA
jgi:hypothetical protein